MPAVTDNPARSRFEMTLQGGTAFVRYRREGGVLVLLHAEVPAKLGGQGFGSKLVEGTLLAIRGQGLAVLPRCSFVRAFMADHPEFDDLRAPHLLA